MARTHQRQHMCARVIGAYGMHDKAMQDEAKQADNVIEKLRMHIV